MEMKKLKRIVTFFIVISNILCSSISFASTPVWDNCHNIWHLVNSGAYGAYTNSVIQTVDSKWTNDENHNNNKVNFEIWYDFYRDNIRVKWVEIGCK